MAAESSTWRTNREISVLAQNLCEAIVKGKLWVVRASKNAKREKKKLLSQQPDL